MTTTLPTIAPTGYDKTINDFLKTKSDKSGAIRLSTGSVSIPATTASGTLVGLIPFNKGAKLAYGSRVYTADLDTSTNVKLDIGYTYYDSTTGTSDPNAFVAAATTAQTGGMIEMTAVEGATWTAAADGWITATIGGAATTTTGSLTFNLGVAYDASGVTNA